MPASSYTRVIKRRWEVWPGRQKFYCDGYIILGNGQNFLLLTLLLIVVPFVLFLAFDCPYLSYRLSPAIVIIGVWLATLTLTFLLRAAFMDPGILPRASTAESDQNQPYNQPAHLRSSYNRTKEVMINGHKVVLKWCFTCQLFRPPRASHCSSCDCCCLNFDHHCPWISQCVGLRNYRYFYGFIVTVSFLCLYVFSFSAAHLGLLARDEIDLNPGVEMPFSKALRKSPASVVVCIISFLASWSVIGLSVFHTFLLATNQTTNEEIKSTITENSDRVNPYTLDGSSYIRNITQALCAELIPSLIDRRGIITTEEDLDSDSPSPVIGPTESASSSLLMNSLEKTPYVSSSLQHLSRRWSVPSDTDDHRRSPLSISGSQIGMHGSISDEHEEHDIIDTESTSLLIDCEADSLELTEISLIQ